ncbi:MAG: BTAD domain-containing putative transcriptional regulator [Propionibacteriaceae bacterium]|nr:BTAD domain-containing putative transcriptional regulator [Propionibacteriaceae bacterium]
MRVLLLGPCQVLDDAGAAVPLTGRRMAGLIGRLSLSPGRVVAAETLVDSLWDDTPGGGVDTLRRLASRTRTRLADHGVQIGPVADSGGYRLDLAPVEVDAAVFERLAAEGAQLLRDKAWDRAVQAFDEALALWRGQPLGGIDAGFAEREARRLEGIRLAVAEGRIDALSHQGDPGRLLPELQALGAAHPTRERTQALLMRLLHAAGQRGEALRVYEELRRHLAEELGTDPSPQLAELHRDILRDTEAPSRTWTNPFLTRFFGRRGELAAIEANMARTRLVTLHGPGGVGKTRLAAEYAAGVSDARVCFVELGPLQESDSLVAAIAATLGSGDALLAAAGGQVVRLISALSAVPTLLVLDNCEHLIGAVADLALRLLAECPELRILATSREPLAVTGEALVRVEPLTVGGGDGGDAVAMFTDLVSLVQPDFRIDPANEAVVTEICQRLDGLPLGIELAAARARSMTVQEIARHLDERFRLLAGARRSGAARHRTLRAVLDWTWNLLSAQERLLARRLSVLPGGATVASARAVCADGGLPAADVPFVLSALTDKSLVQATTARGGEPRHRLMETPRVYLLGQLRDAGEEQAARDAAVGFFVDLVGEAFDLVLGRDQIQGLARLDAEHDNILDSLRHAVATGDTAAAAAIVAPMSWYWIIRGRYEEAAGWLDELVDRHGDALTPTLRTVSAAVRAVLPRDAPADAGAPGAAPTALARDDEAWGDYPPLAMILPNHQLLTGDHAGVRAYAALAVAHPHPWVRAAGHAASALAAEADGDAAGAEREVEASVAAFRQVGDLWTTAQLLAGLAGFQSARGDTDGAVESLRQALQLERSLGPSQRRTAILVRLGGELARAGRAEEARRAFAEGLDPAMMPTAESRILALVGLADVELQRGDLAKTDEVLAQARALMDRRLADPVFLAVVVGCREVALLLALAEPERAVEQAWQVWAAAGGLGDAAVRAETAEVVADALLQSGDAVRAAQALGTAASIRGRRDDGSPRVARLMRSLDDRLGPDAFAAAYAQGESGATPLER